MRPDERVAGALAAWGVEGAKLLAGDASSRRYLRGFRGDTSVVVMDTGAPIPAAGDVDPFPFTRWQRFYDELAIRVPRVEDVDRARGLVLLEDLGDELLQNRVEDAGAPACRAFYLRAAEWALRLSDEGTARFVPDARTPDDPLDAARLAVEMDLFLVEAARIPVPDDAQERPPFARAAAALEVATGAAIEARRLLHQLCVDVHGGAPRPMVLCHRDYHARNLLLVPDGSREDVAVIDFQDTRRGPRAYDLVSLAWDPYVALPDGQVAELVDAWRPADASPDAWLAELAPCAGQRLLKAAGSYAWLGHSCGRREYLQWLAPALARAHERLASWTPRDELWTLLAEAGVEAPGRNSLN
jgi:aminoglycoside/choline kinase family phosphotransferase